MDQLLLTQDDLERLGFKGKWFAGDEFNESCSYWQFSILNGYIIFNPNKPPYIWYLKTEIGELSNWLHLDIKTIYDLIDLFRFLGVKIEHLFT